MASTELLLLFLTCILGALYIWLKHSYGYWRRRGVAYIEPNAFLGNTKAAFTLRNSFGLHLSEIYGDKRMQNEPVVGIYILNKPGLIIRDPEIIKTVLIKEFSEFTNRYGTVDPHSDVLGSYNLFFVKNPKWRTIRTKLTPIFTSGKIRQMYPLMQKIGTDLEAHLAKYDNKKSDRSGIEIKEICALYTTDVIASIAYGIGINCLQNPNTEFRLEGRKVFAANIWRAFSFSTMFYLPELVRFLRVKVFSERFTNYLRKTIRHVMDERERSGLVRNDLIDTLLMIKKEAANNREYSYISDNSDFLVAQAAVFFTAGFETSSSTMSFALYELAKQPMLQQRLRLEINAALMKCDGDISYEQVQALEYLGMVIDEVLRLYPILPFLDRECTSTNGKKSFSFKPYSDLEIPNGMPIYIPIFGIHRDPQYWPNPNLFDPERFSAENKKNHRSMTYLPFGTGPHNCIGSRLGLLQVKIGLLHILKNHYVSTCDRTVDKIQLDPKSVVLHCLGGIYLDIDYDGLYDKSRSQC